MGEIFVRAKPSKIAINETYYYEGSIGDNSHWDFQGAEGEIKIAFPYDGYFNGCFDKTAQEDLRQQDSDGQAKTARVGYLGIVKAGKTSFKKALFEGSTIPISIGVENIQEKLESGQEAYIHIRYRPDKPEDRPFLIGEVKLTDQDPFEDSPSPEYKPQYYPFPTLLIEFNTPIRGDLWDIQNLSLERIKGFIKSIQAGQTEEIKPLEGSSTAGQISATLLDLTRSNRSGILIIGLNPFGEIDSLSKEDEQSILKRIAGAVLLYDLPIPIFTPVIRTIDKDKGQKVAIVITPPGLKNRIGSNQDLKLLPLIQDSQLSEKLVDELLEKPKQNVVIPYREAPSPDNEAAVNQLARVFAGMANGNGGYVLFGLQSRANDYVITGLDFRNLYFGEQAVEKALEAVKPLQGIICRTNRLPYERNDGSKALLLIVQISGDLSEVYSVDNRCWRVELKKTWEVVEMPPNAIFELLTQKYKYFLQRTVVKGEPPKIAYAYLKWPHTRLEGTSGITSLNYNTSNNNLPGTSSSYLQVQDNTYLPSKYDPLEGAMEWHEVPFNVIESSRFYETTLQLGVQNPEDLRDPSKDNMTRDLPGYVEILLGPPILSGLETIYFDAEGKRLEAEKQEKIVSYQTKLVLRMCLRTSDLFKKRDFSPYRQLEFEGVLPERARYEDVREALHDCGLRATPPTDIGPLVQKGLPRETIWHAESRTSAGKFIILLRITNYWYEIQREISYGERTDKMSVPSGRMSISIFGSVEGADNKDLTVLINKLQIQLKERFKFVRVG